MRIFIVSIALFFSYAFTWPNFITDDSTTVVEIELLNPDLFKEYMLNSLENSNIEILEACIPAKVIYVKYSGLLDDSAVAELENFFSQPASTGTVKILLDDSKDDFTEKCLAARLGN